ncbi:hypothetical protein [Virgibacillus pantothenticus]|uniref:hypothetical protein n=1 Tax=Virgibacillus pantothenticus TaxID=1473 RepID=UPI00098794DA|nr:hypothetical protein [Virgibacillus pantothenticus]
MEKMKNIQKKLLQLQKMNDTYLKELKIVATEMKSQQFQIVSYFTYSLHLNHELEGENFIIGSYHITNFGFKPLHHPYICIKLSSEDVFDFSGKYFYPDTQQKMKLANAWLRFNEAENRQEFWLKPNNQQILEPQETLTFQNFQLKWEANKPYAGYVTGFIYGDEIKEGISAVNQISVSGNVKEENDDEG